MCFFSKKMHILAEKVNTFCEKILHKFTSREPQVFMQVAGSAPGQKSGPRHVRKRGSMRPSLQGS